MTRRIVVKSAMLSKIWKETAKKLKLARMKSKSLEEYHKLAFKYFDLHSYYEYLVGEDEIRIKTVDYIKLLNALEKEDNYTSVKKFLEKYEGNKGQKYSPKNITTRRRNNI